jgi:hypothetical protein
MFKGKETDRARPHRECSHSPRAATTLLVRYIGRPVRQLPAVQEARPRPRPLFQQHKRCATDRRHEGLQRPKNSLRGPGKASQNPTGTLPRPDAFLYWPSARSQIDLFPCLEQRAQQNPSELQLCDLNAWIEGEYVNSRISWRWCELIALARRRDSKRIM